MTTIDEMLDALWRDYVAQAPQALRIHRLLGERGERVRNDHIALRTYGLPGIGISALAAPFEAHGWQRRDRYRFDDKHLIAYYWQHPDPLRPKVFISELCVSEMAFGTQQIIDRLVAQLPRDFGARADLPWAGRPWQIKRAEYETMILGSEYAAWVGAFGFRVNHFTVDVNHLTTFPDLQSLDAFLVEHGFRLNDAGGAIKGTRAECLEQSSTRADSIAVEFSDGTLEIPSCYYEFAKRHRLPSGELFQGFVPASADKIFESTDRK
ncbi:MAG: succinyldiaminopimelate aminotransferase [Myxococcales bacterium]|nr:succinyldiaminopimelate aminotransferase [Myxococcales bacterium]